MTPGGPEKGIFTRIYYPSIYPVNETINKVDKLFIILLQLVYVSNFLRFCL